MNSDDTPKRGAFGYEGEGFEHENVPEEQPRDHSAERGWNIGREDGEPESERPDDSGGSPP